MRHKFNALVVPSTVALSLVVARAASAQSLADFCPEADPETAAVVGFLYADIGMPLSGTVAASWVADGSRQRIETEAGTDGLFALCGLPMNTEMSLRATSAGRSSPSVVYTTEAPLAQQDLTVWLTADQESVAEAEIGSLSQGSRNRAFSSDIIREEDILELPEMSVLDLLRRHQKLRVDRVTGQGEVILLTDASTSLGGGGGRQGVQVRVDERVERDPVNFLRSLSIDEISRIEILDRGEASARYGGDGWIGAIVIRTKSG